MTVTHNYGMNFFEMYILQFWYFCCMFVVVVATVSTVDVARIHRKHLAKENVV